MRRLLGLVLLIGLGVASVQACSIPVYRYALERWDTDPYRVVVFYENELVPGTGEQLEPLVRASSAIYGEVPAEVNAVPGDLKANLSLRFVDLTEDPDPQMLKLWESQVHPELPWVVIRFPHSARLKHVLWRGPLDALPSDTLTESPARKEVVEHLIQGQTAVWVLLETGDEAQDEKALTQLTEGLKKSQAELNLPTLDESDEDEWLSGKDKTPLKIDFHVIRVARSNQQEIPLVTMLVKSHPEVLKHLREPLAFPVFGRGRSLLGLAGEEITETSVVEACRFLIEACQCTVKEQNPGVDLLLTANWERIFENIDPLADQAETLLVSITDFLESEEGEPVQAATVTPASVAPATVSAEGKSPLTLVLTFLAICGVVLMTWTLRRFNSHSGHNL